MADPVEKLDNLGLPEPIEKRLRELETRLERLEHPEIVKFQSSGGKLVSPYEYIRQLEDLVRERRESEDLLKSDNTYLLKERDRLKADLEEMKVRHQYIVTSIRDERDTVVNGLREEVNQLKNRLKGEQGWPDKK